VPAADRAEVAAALKAVLLRHSKGLHVEDGPRGTSVSSTFEFRGRPMWLAGVQLAKSYVSYHLMPAYMFPDLLDGVSDELRARMQGKACFNFRTVDPVLFRELEALTRAGFARFRADGPAHLAKFEKR